MKPAQTWKDRDPEFPGSAARFEYGERRTTEANEQATAEVLALRERLTEETLTHAGYLNALNHGVSRAGGDQTSAFETFFNLCHTEAKNAFIPKGEYESGKIVKEYGLNLIGEPGTIIKVKAGTAGVCWNFEGSVGTAKNLEAQAGVGTRELKLNNLTGISVGSILDIQTETLVNGGQAECWCGQLVQVVEVKAGESKVKTRERMYRTFTVTGGADKTTVKVVTPIEMEASGLKFINPTEANCRFLQVLNGKNIDIEMESETPLQPAIEIQNCYGFRVTSRSEFGQWENLNKFGYGVSASGGSCHGQVNTVCLNGNFAFSSTGVTKIAGEPYDITVTGLCDNSSKSGVFLHPEGHDITVSNMLIYNPTEHGVEVACPKATVQGCTIIGPVEHGVRLATNALNNVRIVGNTISECEGRGVYVNVTTAMEDITIAENVFSNIGLQCINSTGEITRLRQHGNTFRNYGTLKAEGYCTRHQKKLVGGAIYDETIDAEGASEKVFVFDIAATKTIVTRVICKNVSGTKWFKNVAVESTTAGEAGATLVEVEGVSYYYMNFNKP